MTGVANMFADLNGPRGRNRVDTRTNPNLPARQNGVHLMDRTKTLTLLDKAAAPADPLDALRHVPDTLRGAASEISLCLSEAIEILGDLAEDIDKVTSDELAGVVHLLGSAMIERGVVSDIADDLELALR